MVRSRAAVNMGHKRIRRVLLIQPPYNCASDRGDLTPNAPLGLAYIAAVMEKAGYEVEILDAFVEGWETETPASPGVLRIGLSFSTITEIIAARRPDAVGITCMFTSQRRNAHRVADLAKGVDPSIIVIMGGAHVTAAPEMVMEDPNVDVAVLGEGEQVIVPLLKAIEGGTDLHTLKGIAMHGANGTVTDRPPLAAVEDLDAVPFPARHLLPMEKYFALGMRHGGRKEGNRSAAIVTSRGCQYRCNFCTAHKVFGHVPRLRSVPNIIAEMDELVDRYRINDLYFEDDQLLSKLSRAEELFDAMTARGYGVRWDTPNGVSPWLLNDRILAKMKAAGCYRVNLAVESGNQWVLDNLIGKPVKLARVPEVVRMIRRHGMEPGIFLVAGNIGAAGVETRGQIRESFALARKLGINPQASILTPYPGSEVLAVAREKGYLVSDFDWDNLVIRHSNLHTPEWTAEELQHLVEDEKARSVASYVLHHPASSLLQGWRSMKRHPKSFPRRAARIASTVWKRTANVG